VTGGVMRSKSAKLHGVHHPTRLPFAIFGCWQRPSDRPAISKMAKQGQARRYQTLQATDKRHHPGGTPVVGRCRQLLAAENAR
jgi:hypothetical protein